MKNIDRIKQMTFRELAKFIQQDKCNICVYEYTNCQHDMCTEGVAEWLEQEGELTIKEVAYEFNKFCKESNCLQCDHADYVDCNRNFLIDNFNSIDGKITRR